MKVLFEIDLAGHRMEYIHHIYMGMIQHPECEYTIVLPTDFNQRREQYYWPPSNHVHFDFLDDEQVEKVRSNYLFLSVLKRSILLKRYVRKYDADSVFLLGLMDYIPFLPFMLSRKHRVISIIYKIYLYEWHNYSFFRKIQEIIKYKSMKYGWCIDTVFILNDKSAAACLNRIYKSAKFQYISDPFNTINYSGNNIRQALGIPSDHKVFLHFGGLQERKGTLDIMNAIYLLTEDERKRVTFIFTGKIYNNIKKQFYEKYEELKVKCNILVFDKYCDVRFLYDLVCSTDFMIIPYHVTAQSSGLLGFVPIFKKPVIGPSDGLIGKLIRRYKLGLMLPSVTPENIAKMVVNAHPYTLETTYGSRIKEEEFISQIFMRF